MVTLSVLCLCLLGVCCAGILQSQQDTPTDVSTRERRAGRQRIPKTENECRRQRCRWIVGKCKCLTRTTKRVDTKRTTKRLVVKRVPATTQKPVVCDKNMVVKYNKCECAKGFEWENGQRSRCRTSCDQESQEWNWIKGRCVCRHGYVDAPGGTCSKKWLPPAISTITGGTKTVDKQTKNVGSKVSHPLDSTISSSTLTATEGTTSTTSQTWHVPVVQDTTSTSQEGSTSKRWHVTVTEDTAEVTSSTISQTWLVPVVEDTTPTSQAGSTSKRWHVPVTEDVIATTTQSSTGSSEPIVSSDILDYKVLPPHRASKASARGRLCLPLFLITGLFLVLH